MDEPLTPYMEVHFEFIILMTINLNLYKKGKEFLADFSTIYIYDLYIYI